MSRKQVEKKAISQEWLTTYADMITLILVFFVLLYAYSLVDSKKFQAAANSLSVALGGGKLSVIALSDKKDSPPVQVNVEPSEEGLVKETESITKNNADNTTNSNTEITTMYNTVSEFVSKNNLDVYVKVREDIRGVIIEFNNKILFDTGKAEIREQSIGALMKIAELFYTIHNKIIIEGHTDNIPISTEQFPSNWELSAKRAINVLRYLTENRQISPTRFSAIACGEYSPIADNSTPEGRMQNRRVNILIVTSDKTGKS